MITGSYSDCKKIQTTTNSRFVVTQRSGLVSFALVLIPTIILVAFRILTPELNEALSNDFFGQTVMHSLAIFLGLIMAYRYSSIHDHEYRRSKAIDALSKTYKLEDKGLWEKGEIAIQKLEVRAFSDFKGRKASASRQRMQGNIGQINRESAELDQKPEEHSDYSISVDGVEQKKERVDEQIPSKQNLLDRISDFFANSIERTANRRTERRKKEESQKSESIPPLDQDSGSRWQIPEGTLKKTRFCNQCSTYNEANSNYCSSCGSFIS